MGSGMPGFAFYCGSVSTLLHTCGPVPQIRMTASCLLTRLIKSERQTERATKSAEEKNEGATTAVSLCR